MGPVAGRTSRPAVGLFLYPFRGLALTKRTPADRVAPRVGILPWELAPPFTTMVATRSLRVSTATVLVRISTFFAIATRP